MFGKFKNQMDLFKQAAELLKDENVRALMGHPKFQQLMKDPEFQALMRSQQMDKLASHPKFAEVMKDPELGALILKIQGKFRPPSE